MSKLIHHPHFYPLLILLSSSILFFYPIFFQNHSLFFFDTLSHRIPSAVYWRQSVKAGRIPLWNPYIFAGLPHLADLSNNTLSPFNLIYLLVPNPFQALSLLVVFLVFLSGFSMYAFLHSQRLSPTASLTGALTFAFSGSTLAMANDVNALAGIAFVPLAAYATHFLLTHKSKTALLFLALVFVYQFISGHPQYSYYTWFLSLTFAISSSPRLATVKSWLFSFLIFISLASIQLLPFWELSQLTYRPPDISRSQFTALQILDLPRFVLAHLWGTWVDGTSWGPKAPMEVGRGNSEGYLGLIPLGLAIIASQHRFRHKLFFFLVAILGLLLAFGPHSPLYPLSQLLPFYAKFRAHTRALILYVFAISVFSAQGLQSLISSHESTRP